MLTEPLDRRGWALQERVLSRRIVEFGWWQTPWICHESLNGRLKYFPSDGWKQEIRLPFNVYTHSLPSAILSPGSPQKDIVPNSRELHSSKPHRRSRSTPRYFRYRFSVSTLVFLPLLCSTVGISFPSQLIVASWPRHPTLSKAYSISCALMVLGSHQLWSEFPILD